MANQGWGGGPVGRVEMARGRQIVRVLATLAVAFGVAVVLSWGILGFFGQRSADRAEHSLVGILLLLGYMAASGSISVRRSAFFFAVLVPCYLGTVFPDLDIRLLGIGGHRDPPLPQ